MTEKNLTQLNNLNNSAIKSLEIKSGVAISDCYQCGKCTASCPMAHAMDNTPRQIIRYLQLGLLEEALNSKTPWICASCHTCSARCPHDVDLANLMEIIQQEAASLNIIPDKDINTFNKLFMKSVELFGRSHEVMLIGSYNLLSKHFLQDVTSAPYLFLTRKIGILPHMVKDRKAVQNLIEKTYKRGEK